MVPSKSLFELGPASWEAYHFPANTDIIECSLAQSQAIFTPSPFHTEQGGAARLG